MVHLATEDVDRGPVVSYCTVPIVGGSFTPLWKELDQQDSDQVKAKHGEQYPLFQLIRQAEFQREPYLIFETLQSLAQVQVLLRGGRVLDHTGQPLAATQPSGLCLDPQINNSMNSDGIQPLQ